jgi:prefoldin subunit 5
MQTEERTQEIKNEIDRIESSLRGLRIELLDTERDLDEVQTEVDNFEIDEDNYEEQYCEMLNEDGDIMIGSLRFTPSDVLNEMDPTAYSIGLSDYVDSLDIDDDPEYEKLKEDLESLEENKERTEEMIEELEEELEGLEEELNDLQNETEDN